MAAAGHHDWESVTLEGAGHIYTERMRVPGGWLYRTLVLSVDGRGEKEAPAVALAFVPISGGPFPSPNAGLEQH